MRRAFWSASAVITLLLSSSASFHAQPSTSSGISLVLSERIHANSVTAIAIDSEGYVWAVGSAPAGMPTSPDALVPAAPGGAFLERIAPDGSLSYLTYLGTGGEVAHAIALDGAGNIYVAGSTSSPAFPNHRGRLRQDMRRRWRLPEQRRLRHEARAGRPFDRVFHVPGREQVRRRGGDRGGRERTGPCRRKDGQRGFSGHGRRARHHAERGSRAGRILRAAQRRRIAARVLDLPRRLRHG